MNLTIDDLKESNEFLRILSQNLNSAIFIVDQEVRIRDFNQTTEILFQKDSQDLLGNLCGNSLGCIYPVEEKTECGKTSFCNFCPLRKSILRAFNLKAPSVNQPMSRIFVINGQKVHKYFYFSVKYVQVHQTEMALIIVDDLTEMERQKHEIAEKNKAMESDLDLAAQIQKNLIPSTPPAISATAFSCLYEPMQQLGGDFYDFLDLGKADQTGIFISDVSGHGVPAALITSMVKTLLDNSGNYRLSCGGLLSYLNDKLLGKTCENFLTAFYGIYDGNSKTLVYSRAGHPYPVLIRRGEQIPLGGEGMVLGVFQKLGFSEEILRLQPGDRILFFTDGLMEATNDEGMFFAKKFPSLIQELSNKDFSEFLEILYGEFQNFRRAGDLEDDVCLVAMEIL